MSARQPDLFGKPRAKPRKLMRVFDVDDSRTGFHEPGPVRVRFECPWCDHETDWIDLGSATEAKRGIVCPHCNPPEVVEQHTCHWPGCGRVVPPALWGCKEHWFALPKALRDRIWATYVPGQEITKKPSSEYIAAAVAVQDWIRATSQPKQGENDGAK